MAAKGYTDIEIDYRAAKRDWVEAQTVAQSLGETQWAIRADGELGLVAFLEGNPIRAARLLGRALLSTMANGDIGGQIRFLELIGTGFEEANRHAEALKFFERAIHVGEAEKDCGPPFMAYEGEARALVGLGKTNDAKKVLEDALAKARSQQKHGHEVQLLILLGKLAAQNGDMKQAVSYLEGAGPFAARMQCFRMEADAMFELAKIYRDAGDLTNAETRATEGLAASQRVGDRYYLPRNLNILAELKARRGHTSEANSMYAQAEDVIEGMFSGVDDPYWNSSIAGSMSEIFLKHFELLSRSGDVASAFRVLERVRGRTLVGALKGRSALQAAESQQAAALETEIARLQVQLMRSNDPADREHVLDALVERERRFAFEWTTEDRPYQRLPVQPSLLGRVQEDLKSGEVLLEYVLDEPSSFCLLITRRRAYSRVLPAGRTQIENLAQNFINEIRTKRTATESAKQLYDVLVKPEAATATRLIIAPDGILDLLPFDALRDSRGEYLLKSLVISYVPSGTILDMLQSSGGQQLAPKPLLALGDVAYKDQSRTGRKMPQQQSIREKVQYSMADLLGIGFHDLPQSREEIADIARIFGRDAVILLGNDASESAFKRQPLDQFRMLHLAVHGFSDTQYPERSGLVLGVDPKSNDDGLLQAREIVRLKLNAELTTLSACDGGVGKLQGQEGITNLVVAFLIAGSKSVVASLWNADDNSTSALMQGFYEHLAKGEAISSALRQAKIDLLTKYGDELSPYFWAAFIATGETSQTIRFN